MKPVEAFLPPLHINLWLMKNSAESGGRYPHPPPTIAVSFRISEMPKLKRGIFVGPQITKVMLDENFAKETEFRWLNWSRGNPSNRGLLGQKRGKLPRNHTKSVTELPEVSCHWNSTSYIHTSDSLPENLEPSVMINMKCFLSIQQKSSSGVSEGGIRLWWGITAADETSHKRRK